MDTKDFLKRVLPAAGGDYFGVYIQGGQTRQFKLGSIEDLDDWIKRHRTTKNVYFATGVYDGRRTVESTKLKRALYLDLDVGQSEPGKPKYSTQKEALAALVKFSKKHFVMPTLIVNSGRGIHAYWTFTLPVALARWRPMADAFKQLVDDCGMLSDKAVTADAARIMRAPNTINFREGQTRPVTSFVIHDAATDYTADELSDKLNVAKPRAALALAVDNDDLSGGVEQREREWSAKRMVAACPMFADAYATGGAGLPENVWTQQLHVLAYCTDGEEFVHEISRGYKGYAEAETRMKWNQRKAQKERTGPTRCETFAQWSPHCATCPHRGSITSPIQLGGERDATLPFPYSQDEKGVFFMVNRPDDDGNDVPVRVSVLQYKVSEFSVVYADGATHIQFMAEAADAKHRVELDLADVSERKTCTRALNAARVVLMYDEYNNFRDFMNTWAKRMQDAKRTQRAWQQLGWTHNPDGFALSEEVIFKDGRRIQNLAPDRVLHNLYKPTGDIEPWVRAAGLLMANDRMASIVAVGTAFGAPLSPWVRDPSAMMSFVSKRSGTGKTTALEVGQAVWGHPTHAMFQLDDTQNSVYRKLSFANNLPGYWDELRTKEDTARVGRMLFQLTGGRDKARLTASVELRDSGAWNTILSAASNESIADVAIHTARDTEAGRARVFELVMPPLADDQRLAELDKAMMELRKNFGVAGVAYVEFLVRNEEACKGIVHKTHERLARKLNTQSVERFWLSSVTKIICGLMFAKRLGLVQVDIAAVEDFLCNAFEEQRGELVAEFGVSSSGDQSTEILLEFLAEHVDATTVYDRLPGVGDDVGRIYATPKFGEVVGSVSLLDKRYRVTRKAFREWMYFKKVGTPKMLLQSLTHRLVRARVTVDGVSPRIWCYEFLIPGLEFGDTKDFTEFEEPPATSSDAESTDAASETDHADH